MKPDPYDFEMYLWSNGAAYTDEDGKLEKNLNSKKSKEVFEMFQEMEKEEYAVATEKTGTDEFRAGNTAMYVYGSWAINSLEEDGMNYGVVNIPSFADADHPSVSILVLRESQFQKIQNTKKRHGNCKILDKRRDEQRKNRPGTSSVK